MGDIHVLIRSLREFSRNDEIVKALRVTLREPVDPVRRRIRATAIGTLPKRGGLGAWVAQTKITAAVTLRGKAAGIRMRGGRRSIANLRGSVLGGQSDVRAIDRGKVRAPSWGRRSRGQWHTQTVQEGFFTKTAAESPEWEQAIEKGVNQATEALHA